MKKKEDHRTDFRTLTRAEEEVMQILWELGEGLVYDVLERLPEPKPAYNTVSTIIRILEQKGFTGHRAYGRTHVYYPVVSKKDYTRSYFKNMISGYFGNSYKALASFFAGEEELGLHELEEIRKLIDKEIAQRTTNTESRTPKTENQDQGHERDH
jgi:BlaI family transcriptional regulator, penicillinase repressor